MKLEIKFGNAKHPFAARRVVPKNGTPFCTMAFDVVDKETGFLIREGSLDLNEQATKITGVRVKTGNWETIPNTEDFRRTSVRIPLAPKSGRIDVELDEHGNIISAEDEKVAIKDPIISAVVAKASAMATIETYDSDSGTGETAHHTEDPGTGDFDEPDEPKTKSGFQASSGAPEVADDPKPRKGKGR